MASKINRDSKTILKDIWDGKPMKEVISSMYDPLVFWDANGLYWVRVKGKSVSYTKAEFEELCSQFGPFLIMIARGDEHLD